MDIWGDSILENANTQTSLSYPRSTQHPCEKSTPSCGSVCLDLYYVLRSKHSFLISANSWSPWMSSCHKEQVWVLGSRVESLYTGNYFHRRPGNGCWSRPFGGVGGEMDFVNWKGSWIKRKAYAFQFSKKLSIQWQITSRWYNGTKLPCSWLLFNSYTIGESYIPTNWIRMGRKLRYFLAFVCMCVCMCD